LHNVLIDHRCIESVFSRYHIFSNLCKNALTITNYSIYLDYINKQNINVLHQAFVKAEYQENLRGSKLFYSNGREL
jgi:hypothetical protein